MASEVKLSVVADLDRLVAELGKVRDAAAKTTDELKRQGDEVEKGLNNNIKQTETFFGKLTNTGRRVADQLRGDFKSLIALNAIQESLKLSNQFKSIVGETITLSDTIRKLGGTFGITADKFSSFQTKMTKGLGEIGASSEAAANALQGLSRTPVRGEDNLLEYSKQSAMLASATGQKGQEGQVAKGMSDILQAQGVNPNDVNAMKTLASQILKVREATGSGATETISSMQKMFEGMSADFRKSVTPDTIGKIAAASATAGPNATAFLEQYLKMSKVQRSGLEARGVGSLVGPKGLSTENIKKFYEEAKKLGGGDIRVGLGAMGVAGDEAQEGFVRLAESIDRVKDAQEKYSTSLGDVETSYKQSRTMGEAWAANVNKIKGAVAGPLSKVTDVMTGALGNMSESTGGAALAVGGAATAAAILAGIGTRGIGGGLLGGMVKGKALEAVTGEKVQMVEVINWPAAMSVPGGGAGGMLGKAGGLLGKGMGVLGAAGAGVAVGQAINEYVLPHTMGKTEEGFEGNIVEQLFFKLDKLLGGSNSQNIMKAQKVLVELNPRQLKESKPNTRGGSN